MARKIDICEKCGKDCEFYCQALSELRNIYYEQRSKEKRVLIKKLRKRLNIINAEVAPDLETLGKAVIKKVKELNFIAEFDIKVGYVRSYERKIKDGQATLADCRKVNIVFGAYLPFDFLVIFYEPNIGHLSENQIKILMWHELKHIGIGERGFIVNPHEVEDFHSILDSTSTRWNEYGVEVIDILG